ncbi:hypothetical protein SDRG_08833 [Saprolegnia diclina VS20]|uniref:Adenylate cyclase-associated CAP C-terminal domain-containing protein n=1 Tax=Saprolegnia diclina (strain VS20) TaxID=1156394 RepID=T0QJ03_SAPDV|nr:hypothetical protein SDRG_08833 [Saprolegnia diclina VS20]EQC33730.1 hypothetical protein SDRG_08833 [Saprolegnia diclina VS20]|eukprot:XP_008612953.1 hypothetical protein SDRG_08833 [Saprolegnia diclina VS20]
MLPTSTLLATMQRRPAPVTFEKETDAALTVPPQTSGVFASNIVRCSLKMDTKVTQVTVTASSEIDIAFVSVISSLELVRCHGVRAAFTGTCRTIVVDACDNVMLVVPAESTVRVVSSASTRVRIVTSATQDAYCVPDLDLQTLETCIAPYGRPDYPDFLYYHPCQSTQLIDLAEVSPLWRDIWSHWHKLPWTLKSYTAPTALQHLADLVDTPIWLQVLPTFHVTRPVTQEMCLAVKLGYHRPFYAAVAASDLRTLRSFMSASGEWPTLPQFTALVNGRVAGSDAPRPVSLAVLYKDITHIWQAACLASGATGDGAPRYCTLNRVD